MNNILFYCIYLCIPGWFHNCYVAEDELELQMVLPFFKFWDAQKMVVCYHIRFLSASDGTQGSVLAR